MDHDDGFIWGIGQNLDGSGAQPAFVSGAYGSPTPGSGTPWPRTAFDQYQFVGENNVYFGNETVTIHFPRAGFYPFELDYAEDGYPFPNGQAIDLEFPVGTPLKGGPSPTSTPSQTPTPTPTCGVPTPFAYPWCASAPTATASPTAVSPVSSYYVQPTATAPAGSTPTPRGAPSVWWNQGYAVADSMITSDGPEFGLALLAFGKPDVKYPYPGMPVWRVAYVLADQNSPLEFVTLDAIKPIANDFAAGFFKRASLVHPPDTRPQIVIALGTTNYWSPGRPLSSNEFLLHGIEWGNMVEDLNTVNQSYFPTVQFEGAFDVEFAFSDADHALSWAEGFESATRAPCPWCSRRYYYVYGSCDDCYYPGRSNDDPNKATLSNVHPEATRTGPGPTSTPIVWTVDQAVGVTQANSAALPLPQIYYPGGGIPTRPDSGVGLVSTPTVTASAWISMASREAFPAAPHSRE